LNDAGNLVLTIITDQNGVFSSSLPAGNYNYRINPTNLKNGLSNSAISAGMVSGSLNIVSGATSIITPIGYIIEAETGLIRTGGMGKSNSVYTSIFMLVSGISLGFVAKKKLKIK
jgi:hypothetical protein